MKLGIAALVALLLASSPALADAGDTLDAIQGRGLLRCGVNGEIPGLSHQDEGGAWSGLDVDFCRAVAAAALGGADKVRFVPLATAERLDALAQNRIDLLARNTTWTLSRDLSHGMTFVGVLYFDGQGFIVPRETALMSTLELSGKPICALANSTSLDNAKRYFARHRMALDLVRFDTLALAQQAYLSGKCMALTTDQTQLHALRATLSDPRSHRILPEIISKEPLSPAVRKGDERWLDIVRWTLFVLIDAEELGLTSANVVRAAEQAESEDVRLLLDKDGRTAKSLGLEAGWSQRVIAQVGNYGEVFDRNLGAQSDLKMQRGLNALWNEGGLMFAPPAH